MAGFLSIQTAKLQTCESGTREAELGGFALGFLY